MSRQASEPRRRQDQPGLGLCRGPALSSSTHLVGPGATEQDMVRTAGGNLVWGGVWAWGGRHRPGAEQGKSLQHLGTLPQALHEQAASQAGDTHGSPCSRRYGTIYRAT